MLKVREEHFLREDFHYPGSAFELDEFHIQKSERFDAQKSLANVQLWGQASGPQKAACRHNRVHLTHYQKPIKLQVPGEEIWCQVHYKF